MHPAMKRAACVLLSLAFACVHGRNDSSGPDAQRINASPLEFDSIADDTVDGDEGDATDWRYLDVAQPGVLDVVLHWDNDKANLTLELYDALGKQLANSDVDGQKGRRVQFEAPHKDRYYLRVEAVAQGQTAYSLKATFTKKAPKKCHDCTVGQQVCVGKDGYALCQQTKEGCNAWVEVLSCEADQTCREGQCAVGCTDQCKPDERRCAADDAAQVCTRGTGGCLQWSPPNPCQTGWSCEQGKCKKKGGKPPPPPPPEVKEIFVEGRIISMYTKEGKRTLHIEVGEDKGVKPGMTGVVLESGTNEAVSNGEFKVVKVTGKFAIAETALEAIGNNRTVRIRVK
jgi:hypothetical protein